MRQFLAAGLASLLLFGCGKGVQKKVLVMARGEVTANGNNVTVKDGPGHAEKVLDLDAGSTEINVDAEAGKKTMKVPAEEGYYILNLKKDTLVGSLQQLGKDLSRKDVMTQEDLKRAIDSLEQLTTGANVKAGGNSSIIYPGELKKVSADPDARIYGPFNGIPSEIEPGKDGKEPMLYKFYTNTQMRERIANLKKATI